MKLTGVLETPLSDSEMKQLQFLIHVRVPRFIYALRSISGFHNNEFTVSVRVLLGCLRSVFFTQDVFAFVRVNLWICVCLYIRVCMQVHRGF